MDYDTMMSGGTEIALTPEEEQQVFRRLGQLETRQGAISDNVDLVHGKVDKVLLILETSKLGVASLKWLVSLGAAIATIYGVFYHGK